MVPAYTMPPNADHARAQGRRLARVRSREREDERRLLIPQSPAQAARGPLREHASNQRPGHDVARIVHSRVNAGVSDRCGEHAQRQPRDGQRRAGSGGERECSRGVPGRKGARHGHSNVARGGGSGRRAVRSRPPAKRFERRIHGRRGHGDRREADPGRAAAVGSTDERQRRGGGDRETRVVGGAG